MLQCSNNHFTYHDAAWHGQKGVGNMVDENGQYHGKEQSPTTHERQHCAGGREGAGEVRGPSSCLCDDDGDGRRTIRI